MSVDYLDFIAGKAIEARSRGLERVPTLSPHLFEWQRDIVRWALRRGRAALFEDCGLGKTIQFLEWARVVCEHTGGDVLVLAPSRSPSRPSERRRSSISASPCAAGKPG